MKITSSQISAPQRQPRVSAATPEAKTAELPAETFTFSSEKSKGFNLKPLAAIAGAGAGAYASTLLTGLEPGVGGVANGLVGAVGLGYMGFLAGDGLSSAAGGPDRSADDKILGAFGALALGGAGFVGGAVLGGQGYAFASLAAGAGALVGGAFAASLA